MDSHFERGGLTWGTGRWHFDWRNNGDWGNASWPLATLRATPDKIEISVNIIGKRFDFARHEIKSLTRKRGLLCGGLQIAHRRPNDPPMMIFWSLRPRRLLYRMQQLGYPIGGLSANKICSDPA